MVISNKALSVVLALATTLVAGTTIGQAAYPDKPIKLVVPFAPGGGRQEQAAIDQHGRPRCVNW